MVMQKANLFEKGRKKMPNLEDMLDSIEYKVIETRHKFQKKESLLKVAKELYRDLEKDNDQMFVAIELKGISEIEVSYSCNPNFILCCLCYLCKDEGYSYAQFNDLLLRTIAAYKIILKGEDKE